MQECTYITAAKVYGFRSFPSYRMKVHVENCFTEADTLL